MAVRHLDVSSYHTRGFWPHDRWIHDGAGRFTLASEESFARGIHMHMDRLSCEFLQSIALTIRKAASSKGMASRDPQANHFSYAW